MAEIPIATQILSALKASILVVEFVVKLTGAAEDARVFCMLVKNIFEDVREADRLFAVPVVQERLQLDPAQKAHIEAKISAARKALHKLGGILEKIRVDDQMTGKVRFDHRVRWVLQLETQTMIQERHLAACHRSLLATMQQLRELANNPTGGQIAPPTYEQVVDPSFLAARRRKDRPSKISMRKEYLSVNVVAVGEMSPALEGVPTLFELPSVEPLAPIELRDPSDDLESPAMVSHAENGSSQATSPPNGAVEDDFVPSDDPGTASAFTPLESYVVTSQLHRSVSTSDLDSLPWNARGTMLSPQIDEPRWQYRLKSSMDLARENRRARMKSLSGKHNLDIATKRPTALSQDA